MTVIRLKSYKSVSIASSIRDAVASKKLIEVFDHSAGNSKVGCALLIFSINDFNLFSSCSHKKNMLSMYLHHKYGLCSDYFIISSSSYDINKMPHGGANLVPIAAPCFCLSIFFPNVNMLFFSTASAKSIMVSVETYFSFQLLSRFLNAVCLILQLP